MKNIYECLYALSKSPFRSKFHLKKKDFEYINEKGWQVIEKHAYDFIKTRLAPANLINDGRQTPMKNHPVFIAQHATATCCRGCLEKWYKIPKGRELSIEEMDFIIQLILCWIKREMSNASGN